MQEHSNRLMAGVQKSVMSFRETLCMLCIAAVLGKVIVTVFVSSCLYVYQRMPSVAVFQQFPPNRKIRKSSGKKRSSGGREKYIDSLGAKGGSNTKYVISPFSQGFPTGPFSFDFQNWKTS